MNEPDKTNAEWIEEISCLNHRIRELEQSEAESKRAAEAQRKREEYLLAITQNSSDIIFILDRLGTITYASPSVERFLGYKPDELIGKRSLDLILSHDHPKAVEDFGRALLTKEIAIPDVFCVRHQDGSEHILEGFGKNLLDNPLVAGFVMNVRDVTDRKQAEEALIAREEQYRTLVESASDIVFRLDNTGHVTFVNSAALRITGYEEKEMIGRHYPTLIRPDMREDAMKFFGRQFVKRIPNTYSEYPIIAKDRHELWLGQNTQLIVEKDRVIAFQAVSRDITDRKRVEQELKDSEERYRRIIEASSDAILLRCKNTIVYANPAALKLFRANHPGDLIGIQYLDLVHPDDRAGSAERVKKTMDENWIAPPREHRIMALDGQAVQVESTGVPVQYLGEIHVFGIFRDITERKRVEAKLRQQTDAMEAAIDGMALLNEAGEYFYVNHAHAQLYGYEHAGELIGKSWKILYDSNQLQRFEQEIMPEFGRKGNWHGEAVGKKKDGSAFPQEVSLTATDDGGLICVIRDITERKQAEKALRDSERRYRELSIIDDLTQLYNSRHFYFQLKIELDRANRYGQPLTLLLLDLDDFKAFNDAYGHVEGDQVLWRLGQVVKRCLRETDFAFRYGGEEFTVILPMTTSADGAVTAERIRTEFKKETFSPEPGQDVHVTVSTGLAQYKPQEEMKAFVHRVDQLMYQGKKNGKDRVCCELWPNEPGITTEGHPLSDSAKSNPERIEEISALKQRIRELEQSATASGIEEALWENEEKYDHKDGSKKGLEINIRGIRDGKGVLTDFYGSSRGTTDRKRADEILHESLMQLRRAMQTTIQVLVLAVETKDPYTAGHQKRTANLARAIATEMGLPEEKIEGIRMSGVIHDIGKLSLPSEILSKPTKLTAIEYSLIKEHARQGYEILKDVESPWPLAEIVYQHHERINGSGYPQGLKGKEGILLESRILAVADVVEAMASYRPYRPALGADAAFEEIEKNKGTLYDADVVDACLRLFREKGFQLEET